MDWQQFVIQLTVTLVPVAIAIIRQNGRIAAQNNVIAAQNDRIETLEDENKQLKEQLAIIKHDHTDLQKEYKANLKAQAGMRDTF